MNASIYKKYDATFERQIATARQELENLNLNETIDFHFKWDRARGGYPVRRAPYLIPATLFQKKTHYNFY